MNLLDIDVHDSLPSIINAYTKVFGVEYKDIIEKRIESVVWVTYENLEGIRDYIWFLKNCKEKELAIKFLEKIGIDVSKDHKKYANELDKDLHKLISEYIGGYLGIKSDFPIHEGIRAWLPTDKDTDIKLIEEEKRKFINFFRGEGKVLITEENFEEFCKTDEYKEIYDKIQEYLQILEQLSIEYEDYLQELEVYQEYINNEEIRKKDMEDIHRNALYEKTEEYLTEGLKNFLDEKYSSVDEKSNIFFDDGICLKSYFEYFSKESEEKLNDLSISEDDKSWIYYDRIRYFEKLGITIDNEENFETFKDKYNYIIQQKDVKKLILPEDNINKIIALKKEAFEELQRDFIYSSAKWLEEEKNPKTKEWFYKKMVSKTVCVSGAALKGEFRPFLFFTIREWDRGELDFILLHELCHACDTEGKGTDILRSGFDLMCSDASTNPYNSDKRKYERLNETITDIFAIEARKILQEEGIYILEPPEHTMEDVNDRNTSNICKNLLKPFMKNYRKQIISAKVLGNTKELYDVIGKENFEELNDIINKVDSLEGLTKKLQEEKREEPDVVEYYKQLERLNKVYQNMQNYQSRKETEDILVKSAISATEETTRNGQINNAMIAFTKYLEHNKDDLDAEID